MTEVSLDIIAEDKYAIAYRPKFTALCDSALAAILLQEMIYFWKQKEGKPFYKFKDACEHDLYREGDSWCETLGFNKHEFDTALKVIATKIKKDVSKKDVLATEYPVRKEGESDQDFYTRFTKALSACVIYWTDRNRLTWYQVNETLLCKFVDGIYISKNNGARYLKSCIVAFTSKKAWDERRKDSPKVPAKVPAKTTQKDSSPQNGDVPAEKLFDVLSKMMFPDEPALTKADQALVGIATAWLEGRKPTARQAKRNLEQLTPASNIPELKKFFSWYRVNPDTKNADFPVDVIKLQRHYQNFRKIYPPEVTAEGTHQYYTPTADELAHMEAVKAAALERMNNGRLTA